MRLRWWACLVAFSGLALACQEAAPPSARQTTLEEGALARVGDEPILAETVGRIAAVQELEPSVARDVAIRDVLFATAAREQLSPRDVESAEARILARALLRDVIISSREAPITEDELGRATETYWTRYARPPGFRTIHAVMLAPKDAPPETHVAARERIAKVREAWGPIVEKLRGTQAPEYDEERMFRWNAKAMTEPIKEELEAVAKAAVGELGLKVQQLPPVTSQGYIIDHDQSQSSLDQNFSRVASGLAARGDLSEVVQSVSGWHVIVLLEITPSRLVAERERREALRGFIYRVRAQEHVDQLLGRLRKGSSVPPNHAALLQLVQVTGEG